jgi:hypothetical protein
VIVLEASATRSLAQVWRLACALAPHAAKLSGNQAVQFYVADRSHRMLVFAMEDRQDGNLTVCCPDALGETQAAVVVVGAPEPPAGGARGPGTSERLQIEPLDRESANPRVHFKDMVGWNRTGAPHHAAADRVAGAARGGEDDLRGRGAALPD